jgi:hypothetical protein
VDLHIPRVVFEAAGDWVDAPDSKAGTIESQLQPVITVLEPIVAILERYLIAPPFSEQRGKQYS